MAIKRSESRTRYFIREQAQKRGWNTSHISKGGDCLEEQEIVDCFKDIGLGLDRPDFLLVLAGLPGVVIEAKNSADKIDAAISEAITYAETINTKSKYKIQIAVGAAGEESQGFAVAVRFLKGKAWLPLKSKGYEITTIPSRRE